MLKKSTWKIKKQKNRLIDVIHESAVEEFKYPLVDLHNKLGVKVKSQRGSLYQRI